MNHLSLFFNSLPPTSQAAVIASIVTLCGAILAAALAFIGVFLTHRGNEKRFAEQLKHDRDQKRVEREMALRIQVYLDATEAVVAALEIINRYPNLRIPQEDLAKEYMEKRSAISKVHIIGKEETLNALMAFMSELSATILDLAHKRQQLLQAQARINVLSEQASISLKQRDSLIELMKQMNFEGTIDERRWKYIQTSFDLEKAKLDATFKEKKALEVKLSEDWTAFAAECFSRHSNVSRLLVPATKAVRDELELPLDFEKYKMAIENSVECHYELIKDYLSRLQKQNN